MLKLISKEFKMDNSSVAIFEKRCWRRFKQKIKYSLINEEDQEQTLKEQSTQRKKECYDETCLVDVGKMLSAKGLFMVEVIKSKTSYMLN